MGIFWIILWEIRYLNPAYVLLRCLIYQFGPVLVGLYLRALHSPTFTKYLKSEMLKNRALQDLRFFVDLACCLNTLQHEV